MTKKERLAEVKKAVSDTFTDVKASKQETHEIPETIITSELSAHCQEILGAFGIEAPALLNDYACAVEDALICQVERLQEYKTALETINIHRKELDLENSLLHRRLNLTSDLIKRKQVDDIGELIHQPL